jgi:hypothetical protein
MTRKNNVVTLAQQNELVIYASELPPTGRQPKFLIYKLELISSGNISNSRASSWVPGTFKNRYPHLYSSTFIRNKDRLASQVSKRFAYNRYLIFQFQPDELPSSHPLRKKNQSIRESLRYFCKTLTHSAIQLQLFISKVQVYIIYNLNNVAHGDAHIGQKQYNDSLVDKARVRRIDVDCSEPEYKSSYINVFRSGSIPVERCEGLFDNNMKHTLFQALLGVKPSKGNRGTNKASISMGFAQVQGESNEENMNETSKKKIPDLFIEGEKFLGMMDDKLKLSLGSLVEYFYKLLRARKRNSMNNAVSILSISIGKEISIDSNINISIIREERDELAMHFDKKNDKRIGYNGCVVYSYLWLVDGIVYRVGIVMTFRTTVGALFDN